VIDIFHHANEYNKSQGLPAVNPTMQDSNAQKQKPIARAYQLAADEHPEYKQKVFNAYKEQMPNLVKKAGAHDYDSLKDASYKQFGHEVENHFNHMKNMGTKFSWDKTGEHSYKDSNAMRDDLHNNNHLHVFQGGDDHPHTGSKTNDANGLSQNDKFRAVHDAFGHGILKNGFGPKGEETAWHVHSQMFHPLAKLAMTAETRGQNSWVNYSGANEGRHPKDIIFAPNKAALLPPEMTRHDYNGDVPHYLKDHIKENELNELSVHVLSSYAEKRREKIDPSPNKDIHKKKALKKAIANVNRSYFYDTYPEHLRKPQGSWNSHSKRVHEGEKEDSKLTLKQLMKKMKKREKKAVGGPIASPTESLIENWKYLQYNSSDEALHARKQHFANGGGSNACRHLGDGKLAHKGEFHGPKPVKKTVNEVSIILESGIRPALQHKSGKLIIGKTGQTHLNLIDDPDHFDYNNHEVGFVDDNDKFMNRQEAFKYATKNNLIKKTFRPNKLHGLDLKESLDSHYDYKYEGKTPLFDEHHYTFKSDKGERYYTKIMHFGIPNKDKMLVNFDNKDNQGSAEFTGKEAGSAMKVFSTVHQIIKDHLDKHVGIKEVHFHGSPERAKAYDLMVKKMSKSPKIDKQKFGTMYSYNRSDMK
jgi:hypothetical protein